MEMNKISQTVPLQYDTMFSPFSAAEFDTALDFLAGRGFTGVELAVARPKSVDRADLLKKLKAARLVVTTLSTGQAYTLDGLFLSSFDENVRNAAADLVKGHVDLSAEIGRPPVTIGLLRGKMEKGERTALLENLRRALELCIEYAQKNGVILQIEPINSGETVLINTVSEALEFIAALGNPENVGILYDTFHSFNEDGDMADAIRAARKKITNVHLADSHRGLPGYGHIDFGAVGQALREIGYKGAYALETLVIPDPEFVNKHCYESVIKSI